MKTLLISLILLSNLCAATPLEEKARKVWAALDTRAYKDIAAQMHPDDVESFKQSFSKMLDPAGERHEVVFGKTLTEEELKKMSGREYLTFHFGGLFRNSKPRQPRGVEFVVQVQERPDYIHVIGRMKNSKRRLTGVFIETLTYKKLNGEWWLLLPPPLERLALANAGGFGALENVESLPTSKGKGEQGNTSDTGTGG